MYLGARLPRTYVADHWDVAWVGVDVAEIVLFMGAAWAAWRRRAVLIGFALGAATLVLVDAWFDLTTARRGDLVQSLFATFLIEVPAALAMLWVAHRATRRVVRDVLHHEWRSLVTLPLPGPDAEVAAEKPEP